MGGFKSFLLLITISAAILLISVVSVNGQISSPCSASSISSFTPCINFITGSSSNGSAPTSDCCNSLKSVMSDSMDCACLIITGNVPIPLPINRTLAISLPRLCKNSGIPIQCKATGVPLPAPGPVLFGPSASAFPPANAADTPTATPLSPRASKASALSPPPVETIPEVTPASPPLSSATPTANAGIRPVVTPPSASNPSNYPSSYILLVFIGVMVFKF